MQRKWKHSLAGVALLLALGASPAMAADFNVSGGNVADLIAAINTANSNGEADNIILDGSTFTLTAINNGNNGLPPITSTIIIEGNGSTIQRSSAGGTPAFRIIAINGSGDLTLNETTISGGLVNAGGIGNYGGGIYIIDGTLTITNSTISGNTTNDDGGGIYLNDGTVTITNSTISGNTADDEGGGIYINDGTVTITNSTISGNSANNDGGGIYIDNDTATVSITNSIVSGNTAADSGDNCYNDGGTINDNGNNLSNDGTCNFSGDNNPSINLGPLADNGGPTLTHALLSGSSAIDTGNDAVCNASPVNGEDQRGISRPQLNSCDIGAFEFIDQNNNDIDDCVDTDFFDDIDGDGISDFCDVLIGDITPAPTLSQWGM
ncbi:MAG: choice-of-anchor Q domain-containing protein, partial [Thermodesulfobacteriota bacterium]